MKILSINEMHELGWTIQGTRATKSTGHFVKEKSVLSMRLKATYIENNLKLKLS